MVRPGALVGPGTGDNAAAALGVGAGPGDVVVSIGTSGVVSGISEVQANDPTGTVAGFADATGRFLPLVCTLNAARVLDATARLLGVDHAGLASSRCRHRRVRTGSSWCRTSRASARPTSPGPRGRCTG
jgi:sugar (pentulose or hexulose) kinase